MPRWLPVVVLTLLATPPVAAQRGEVVVSAAASLADVMREAGAAYTRKTGERVAVNTGPSNALARQILAGARVDLFISADDAQMDVVASAIVHGSRAVVASNQLAVVVPDDRPGRLTTAADLAAAHVRRIAIGDPAAVPAGVYARQYLERLGLWPRLQAKLVPTSSVRLALAAVERGAADAAIVYRSDAMAGRRVRVAFVVPADQGPAIRYPAAVLREGTNRAGARRLLDFLRTAEARAIFTRAGFLDPR